MKLLVITVYNSEMCHPKKIIITLTVSALTFQTFYRNTNLPPFTNKLFERVTLSSLSLYEN